MSRQIVTLSIISVGLLISLPSSAQGRAGSFSGGSAATKSQGRGYVRVILNKMEEAGITHRNMPEGIILSRNPFTGTFSRAGITFRKPVGKLSKLTGGKPEKISARIAEQRLVKGKPVIFEKNVGEIEVKTRESGGPIPYVDIKRNYGTTGSKVVMSFAEAAAFWKNEGKAHLLKYSTGPARKEMKELVNRSADDSRYSSPGGVADDWVPVR